METVCIGEVGRIADPRLHSCEVKLESADMQPDASIRRNGEIASNVDDLLVWYRSRLSHVTSSLGWGRRRRKEGKNMDLIDSGTDCKRRQSCDCRDFTHRTAKSGLSLSQLSTFMHFQYMVLLFPREVVALGICSFGTSNNIHKTGRHKDHGLIRIQSA